MPPEPCNSYVIRLWREDWADQAHATGLPAFLCVPSGEVSMYPAGTYACQRFTAATLPSGAKVCPGFLLTGAQTTEAWQRHVGEIAAGYGYDVMYVDIVPWE
jgi:hypothetical protein